MYCFVKKNIVLSNNFYQFLILQFKTLDQEILFNFIQSSMYEK